MRRYYFDHNATTPVDPRVLEAMLPYFGPEYGKRIQLAPIRARRAPRGGVRSTPGRGSAWM